MRCFALASWGMTMMLEIDSPIPSQFLGPAGDPGQVTDGNGSRSPAVAGPARRLECWNRSAAGEIAGPRGSAALPGDPAASRRMPATAPIRPKRAVLQLAITSRNQLAAALGRAGEGLA